MVNSMRQPRRASWGFRSNLSMFCAIYRALNRQAELERLLHWATEKNLASIRKALEDSGYQVLTDAAGNVHKFFGCDAIVIVP